VCARGGLWRRKSRAKSLERALRTQAVRLENNANKIKYAPVRTKRHFYDGSVIQEPIPRRKILTLMRGEEHQLELRTQRCEMLFE
jgi:hypothetical protein